MTRLVLAIALVLIAAPATAQAPACAPTKPDMLGPFYKADAPQRSATGQGLKVTGTVRSAKNCAPLTGARLEWWSANGRGEYSDDLRATQQSDADGRFAYETVAPGRYPGRPPHLHVKVSAPGHRTLVTQLYPRDGERALSADFVLAEQ